MRNILIVVDMQNDFIDGSLGTKEAQEIVTPVAEKIRNFEGDIYGTLDTHEEDYLSTQEGKNLPVPHCIRGTDGWEFPPQLAALAKARRAAVYEKSCFGSTRLASDLAAAPDVESVELAGLCTDICVVSNALLIKAVLPEVPVSVDARCCAGVTPEKHEAALLTMESCQISVRR